MVTFSLFKTISKSVLLSPKAVRNLTPLYKLLSIPIVSTLPELFLLISIFDREVIGTPSLLLISEYVKETLF